MDIQYLNSINISIYLFVWEAKWAERGIFIIYYFLHVVNHAISESPNQNNFNLHKFTIW